MLFSIIIFDYLIPIKGERWTSYTDHSFQPYFKPISYNNSLFCWFNNFCINLNPQFKFQVLVDNV